MVPFENMMVLELLNYYMLSLIIRYCDSHCHYRPHTDADLHSEFLAQSSPFLTFTILLVILFLLQSFGIVANRICLIRFLPVSPTSRLPSCAREARSPPFLPLPPCEPPLSDSGVRGVAAREECEVHRKHGKSAKTLHARRRPVVPTTSPSSSISPRSATW